VYVWIVLNGWETRLGACGCRPPTLTRAPKSVQNGYSTGDPMKRMRGSIKYIGLLFLLGANVRAAVRLLLDV